MADFRLATRRSQLALAQAGWVAQLIQKNRPALVVELVEVTTAGDSDSTSPISALTDVGAFARAVQRAVLTGEADAAVHSCKDLPVEGPEELTAIFPRREVPWDVLCGPTLAELAPGATVGTGSPRRTAQLGAHRPDLVVQEIRGNIDTRLRKLAAGEFNAIVLAAAGLRRLGLEDAVSHRFTLAEMVPAPAQGALAVEVIRDSEAASLVESIDDPDTRRAVETERLVLARAGVGCRSALGAYAEVERDSIKLTGFVSDDAGPRQASVHSPSPSEAAAGLVEMLRL